MFWRFLEALNDHFMTGVFTVVGLGLAGGVCYALWRDWEAAEVPALAELAELRGTGIAPELRTRRTGGPMLWFRIRPDRPPYPGAPEEIELRVYAGDREAMRDALQRGPLDVTAWAPRRQLDARRRDPPEAVQLRAADRMLLSLKTTRDERAAFGWGSPFAVGLSAFFVVAVLVGLAIHWAGILQSR